MLILGTSDRMVVTIAKALDLPMPAKYIRIEDVAKPEDMLKASEARHKEGKHVIPVPTMELKPYFKGYMVDPLRFLRNRKKSRNGSANGMKGPWCVLYSVITANLPFRTKS